MADKSTKQGCPVMTTSSGRPDDSTARRSGGHQVKLTGFVGLMGLIGPMSPMRFEGVSTDRVIAS